MPVYLLWLISAGVSYVAAKVITGQWNLFTFWQHLKEFLTSFWIVVTTIAGWCWFCISHIKDAVVLVGNTLSTVPHWLPGLTQAQGTAVSERLQGWFAMANTFVPLYEFLTFLVAYLGVRIILAGYRFVKSWIPLVS